MEKCRMLPPSRFKLAPIANGFLLASLLSYPAICTSTDHQMQYEASYSAGADTLNSSALTRFGAAISRLSPVNTKPFSTNTARLLQAQATLSSPGLADTIAKPPVWITYPLYGGEMTAIATHPSDQQVIYVGTRSGGLFKTIDGGQTWLPARTGMGVHPIRSLAINSRTPDILYAGTDFDGIWKSVNAGDTWFKAGTGLNEGLVVFQIAIHPDNPDILYAGLAGGLGFTIGNIYKSVDGGASWQQKDTGLPASGSGSHTNGIFSLAINPDHPATLYAGTNYDGAFRSVDNGETWSAINGCLPYRSGSNSYRKPLNALALNPHDDNRLSAIIEGLYYALDDTMCWQQIAGDFEHIGGISRSDLAFHPDEASTIYAASSNWSCFRSSDGGTNWENLHQASAIAFPPSSPDTLFVAANIYHGDPGGVFRSPDQGENWAKISAGITAPAIRSLAIDHLNPDYLYTGTGQGLLFRSHDGGQTWVQLQRDTNNQAFGYEIHDIAVGTADAQSIYVAGSYLFQSPDRGDNFVTVTDIQNPSRIVIPAGTSGTLYVGTADDGIYKSTDNGVTWTQKNDGLPFRLGSNTNFSHIWSLTVDPNNPQTLWTGTWHFKGISRSTDGGEHWTSMGMTNNNMISAIGVKPGNSNQILVGTGDLGKGAIFKSTDGGLTWHIKASDIGTPYEFVYDPEITSWVYAATEGSGVLRSLDGGETWQSHNEGLFYPITYDLEARVGNPATLVAGTYGSGLIHRPASSAINTCSGEHASIQNKTYRTGEKVICWASGSITVQTTVQVQRGAEATYMAPEIKLNANFSVESGGVFHTAWHLD
jgi:photosystem II stability/assembly factor-like uncharacterized protein